MELFLKDWWPEGDEHPERYAEAVRKQIDASGLSVCAITARRWRDAMNYRWAGHDLDTVGRFYSVPRCGRQVAPFEEFQVFVQQSLESLMDL